MNQVSLSVKQILLSRLQPVLELYIPNSSVLTQQNEHNTLHLAKDSSQVLYVSAIAFRLSQVKNIPALEIANTLTTLARSAEFSAVGVDEMEYCWRKQLTIAVNLLQEFTVEVVPPGWIHLEVTELAIAAWLQCLVLFPPQMQISSQKHRQFIQTHTSRLFAVQYTHARCCSIIQMAHREKLITLKKSADASYGVYFAVTPDPIPWLNDQKLRCCHLAERSLIIQLLRIVDDLYYPYTARKLIYWEKAALNLSHTFQDFYSYCRIWGDVKIQTLELAQVRLGLVMITQSVLRSLLQDKLGVPAPLEL